MRTRLRVAVLLLALLAAAALIDGLRLAHDRALNRAIGDGSVAALAGDLTAPALFARAYHLERKGDHQRALDAYKQVESAGDPTLAQAARYNSGNIYLRQALGLGDAGTQQQVLSLAELAKGAYREALRGDSGDWDAKYNLERALRLSPDAEDIGAVEPPAHSERAVTTMKGLSLGLP